jgi:hypothetical protein
MDLLLPLRQANATVIFIWPSPPKPKSLALALIAANGAIVISHGQLRLILATNFLCNSQIPFDGSLAGP